MIDIEILIKKLRFETFVDNVVHITYNSISKEKKERK